MSLPPSAWVVRFAPLIPPAGPVLDLACGAGRHTRLLRRRGHPVTAVDIDLAGIADLDDVEKVQADLEGGAPWPLPGRRFAGIVVTNYLYRPLFPALFDSLAQDGALIYETFMTGQERYGKPKNPAFLLAPGELLRIVPEHLTIVAFEQGLDPTGPAMRQRICVTSGVPVLPG